MGEEQSKPSAIMALFPMLVSSVQLVILSSMGARKGSAGSRAQSPATDVSTASATVKTVPMDHSSKEVIMAPAWRTATMTPVTNTSVKGTGEIYAVLISHFT